MEFRQHPYIIVDSFRSLTVCRFLFQFWLWQKQSWGKISDWRIWWAVFVFNFFNWYYNFFVWFKRLNFRFKIVTGTLCSFWISIFDFNRQIISTPQRTDKQFHKNIRFLSRMFSNLIYKQHSSLTWWTGISDLESWRFLIYLQ